MIVVSALAGVTNALEAALSGAAASRLDIAGFAGAIRERHLALLSAVAQGKPALRAAAAVRERVAELERRLKAVAADGAFSPATRAGVLALGERLSVPVVEAALRTRGLEAQVVDAASLVRTDESFAEAAVDYPATRRLARTALGSLGLGAVPVVTGFLGATESGRDDAPGPRRVGPHGRGARLGARRRARRDLVGRGRRDDRRPAPRADRRDPAPAHLRRGHGARARRGEGAAPAHARAARGAPGSRSSWATRCAPTGRGPGSGPPDLAIEAASATHARARRGPPGDAEGTGTARSLRRRRRASWSGERVPARGLRAHHAGVRAMQRAVTALLGPTNTGKTYLAVERMLRTRPG